MTGSRNHVTCRGDQMKVKLLVSGTKYAAQQRILFSASGELKAALSGQVCGGDFGHEERPLCQARSRWLSLPLSWR
jgi:hypothetical protein